VADDKRVAKRKLEELLMAMSEHQREREAYRKKRDAAGEERSERVLKINYSLIRSHCAKHDLKLPRDVPSEGAG